MSRPTLDIDGIRFEHPTLGALPAKWIERIALICEEEGVFMREVFGRRKLASIARARGRIAFVLRDEAKLSYPEIGRVLGRDPSTIMFAVRSTARALGLCEDAA